MEGFYGNLTTAHGKSHDCLGMNTDFSQKGKIKTSMNKYTQQIIDIFSDIISTPLNHLLKTGYNDM